MTIFGNSIDITPDNTTHAFGAPALSLRGSRPANIITYTLMDIFTGELLEGYTRNQLDLLAPKTKLAPVASVMSALNLKRKMALASSFGRAKNTKLLEMELAILNPQFYAFSHG